MDSCRYTSTTKNGIRSTSEVLFICPQNRAIEILLTIRRTSQLNDTRYGCMRKDFESPGTWTGHQGRVTRLPL